MSKFLNPNKLLARSGLRHGAVVADFGCGSGYFTVAAAKACAPDGQVYGIDILPDKLSATSSAARQKGVRNIRVVQADLTKVLHDPGPNSCDVVVACNIVHEVSSVDALLKNAYRILKSGGTLLVVDWRPEAPHDHLHPSGRLAPEKAHEATLAAGFRPGEELPADDFHYALTFIK